VPLQCCWLVVGAVETLRPQRRRPLRARIHRRSLRLRHHPHLRARIPPRMSRLLKMTARARASISRKRHSRPPMSTPHPSGCCTTQRSTARSMHSRCIFPRLPSRRPRAMLYSWRRSMPRSTQSTQTPGRLCGKSHCSARARHRVTLMAADRSYPRSVLHRPL